MRADVADVDATVGQVLLVVLWRPTSRRLDSVIGNRSVAPDTGAALKEAIGGAGTASGSAAAICVTGFADFFAKRVFARARPSEPCGQSEAMKGRPKWRCGPPHVDDEVVAVDV